MRALAHYLCKNESCTIERKPYRKLADIPPDLAKQLSRGTEETRTLVEALAVDFGILMKSSFKEYGNFFAQHLDPKLKITGKMDAAGAFLLEKLGVSGIAQVTTHPADTIRGWAAYMIRHAPDMTLAQRLNTIRPLANDPHFGVREWAWIALRPHVVAAPDAAVSALAEWVLDKSINIRRYAIEITRPRGVWCTHIHAFRNDPARGLALLDPMKEESGRYAQLSVANWLNDAGKSRPDWVHETCARWQAETQNPDATARIIRHALRNFKRR